MPRWLFALLFTALILYTDDYVIAGVLPELAVANLAAAATSDFWVLMALRVIAALCAGASTPAIFAWTAAQAPPEKIGRYISIVALGVTGAIALGVPAGTLIAQAVSWRGSLLVLAVGALLAIVMTRSTMVSDGQGEDAVPVGRQLRALGSPPVARTLGVNVVAMSCSMMAFTYFAPFLAGAVPDHELRAVTFAVSGLGGIVGVWIGGVLTDRIGPLRTIVVSLLTLAVGCAGSWLLWLAAPLNSLPLIVVLVCLGAVQALGAFSLSPALTARLATTAGDGSKAAIALNTSGTYLGVTIAGAVGGAVLAGWDAGTVVATATLIVVVAAGMFAASTRVAP